MRDPVTGFEYPDTWVSRCMDPEKLRLAEQGLAVLTASGTALVRGLPPGQPLQLLQKRQFSRLQVPSVLSGSAFPAGFLLMSLSKLMPALHCAQSFPAITRQT